GLHRPLRLVAEVLPAAARAVRQHLVEEQSPVRLGSPDDHDGPLAGRFSDGWLPRRGNTVDPQGKRGQAAGFTPVGAQGLDRGSACRSTTSGGSPPSIRTTWPLSKPT